MRRSANVLLFGLLVCLLASCRFNPSNGMTFQQFEDEWVGSRNSDPIRPVRASGSWTVYETDGVFYYFQDDALTGSDQGELWASCVRSAFACTPSESSTPDPVP